MKMKSLQLTAAILSFMVVQIAAQNEITCGQRLVPHQPLMTNAFPSQHWPWHAAIYHRVDDSVQKYKCGGTVITSKSVLTAATCVSVYNSPMETSKVSVSLGRLNLGVNESWSQNFEVSEIFLHPNFSPADMSNDIAIIRLVTEALFNNYVRPICLWHSNKLELSEVVGKEGVVVGFGLTETGKISNVLRQAFMPVLSVTTCLRSNREFFGRFLSPTNFCAGVRNGTSVCKGDGGGAMAFEENGSYYIRGIVSVGATIINKTTQDSDCDSTQYAIFTDVAQYIPWIEGIASMEECRKEVQCEYFMFIDDYLICRIGLNIKVAETKCKVVFSESSNTIVKWLSIVGELEALPDLSDAIEKFENVKVLQLTYIQLEVVERANFSAFRSIETLYLSNNSISELRADTFDDLKNLTELHLGSNLLKELHRDTFKELVNLKRLGLGGNQLEVLPDDLFRGNTKLQAIFLNNNKIKEIYCDTFAGLGNLMKLFLNANHLETLPENLFRDNKKLKSISVGNNKIEVIHRDLFKGLRSLKELSLYGNQLEILPRGLFRSNPRLTNIWLSNNRIKTIETNFQSMPNLVELNLKRNVCMDENCDVRTFCGTASRNEMQRKLRQKCST